MSLSQLKLPEVILYVKFNEIRKTYPVCRNVVVDVDVVQLLFVLFIFNIFFLELLTIDNNQKFFYKHKTYNLLNFHDKLAHRKLSINVVFFSLFLRVSEWKPMIILNPQITYQT